MKQVPKKLNVGSAIRKRAFEDYKSGVANDPIARAINERVSHGNYLSVVMNASTLNHIRDPFELRLKKKYKIVEFSKKKQHTF